MSEKLNQDKNKKPRIIGLGIAAVAVVVSVIIGIVLFGGRLKGATMRLTDYDGHVALTDAAGKELSIQKDRKLLDGNKLSTKTESRAYVTLDEDRLVTLMQESKAAFAQSGKALELKLTEGQLFFNIAKSLKDDESLDIRTSTILIGIRGTSGYVDTDENGSEVLYLTSGKVHCVAKSPDTDDEEEVDVEAGQKLTVTVLDDGSLDVKVEDIPETALPMEAAELIAADEMLLETVLEETDWEEESLLAVADGLNSNFGENRAWTDREDIFPHEDGGYIIFGAYEQDGNLLNGPEPIEWKILSTDNNQTMLISRYVLDAQPYDESGTHGVWSECSLRKWLNSNFMDNAFTQNEQAHILEHLNQNPGTTDYFKQESYSGSPAGEDTTDKIFLLALRDEDARLFSGSTGWASPNIDRIAYPTEYVISQGFSGMSKKFYDEHERYSVDNIVGEASIGAMRYWMRSSGGTQAHAALVDYDGCEHSSSYHGDAKITSQKGVRPVLYIDIVF